MRSIFKDFRTETLIVIILIIGFAFLVADNIFGGQLRSGMGALFNGILDQLKIVRAQASRALLGFSAIQVLAWGLIVGAISWLVLRIRYRFRQSIRFAATVCPLCESPIRRTRRSIIDRILSKTLLPSARRYSCSNPQCDWSGLRHHRYRPQSFAPQEDLNPSQHDPSS